jgi:GNAT superfamily N-acetyltransferase
MVYIVPVPPSEEDIKKYAALRLHCLKTNPEAYSTKYETCLAWTHDKWRSMIDSKNKCVLIAGDWEGVSIVHSPEALKAWGGEVPETGGETYLLTGMFVDPGSRGKGLAKGMLKAAVEWMRSRPASGVEKDRYLALEAYDFNKEARGLYLALGFKEIRSFRDETGHVSIEMTLRV